MESIYLRRYMMEWYQTYRKDLY